MTKKEFQSKTNNMLKYVRTQLDVYRRYTGDKLYKEDMDGIEAHDPALAQLCRDLDRDYLASLQRIAHYISVRVEN